MHYHLFLGLFLPLILKITEKAFSELFSKVRAYDRTGCSNEVPAFGTLTSEAQGSWEAGSLLGCVFF